MATLFTLQKALLISALSIASSFAWHEVSNERILEWVTNSAGFEENLGQVSDFEGNPVSRVYSRIDLKDFAVFITDKGASFVIYKREKTNAAVPLREEARTPDIEAGILHYARIDLELLNASIRKTNISYEEELPGYTNYYLASCPEGILYLKRYQKIRIREIYPGIDWVFKIADAKLHHEFEIEPGADISRIKIKVEWADIEITEDGKRMVLKTPLASVVDGELVAYELKEPEDLVSVKASYQKEANNTIGFKVSGYSGKSTLIIDPPLSLLWATYYAGSDWDGWSSITTDANGDVFITGITRSTNFPTYNPGTGAYYDGTSNGNDDLFLLKFGGSIVGIKEEQISDSKSLLSLGTFFKDKVVLRLLSPPKELVEISLYNAIGEKVLEKSHPGDHAITISGKGIARLPKGVYFLLLKSGNKTMGKVKLIKV